MKLQLRAMMPLIAFGFHVSNAQITFQKAYPGINIGDGSSTQQTSDGGYILAAANSLGGNDDAWLGKTDAFGSMLWTRTFGGPYNDIAHSVRQTTDGGYILTGTYSSSGFNAGLRAMLIKTDIQGDTVWTRIFGNSGSWANGRCVQQTSDGGYIMCGEFYNSNQAYYDIFLIKTDSSGNMLWSKSFSGTNDDYGWFVKQTNDGGYIIASESESFSGGSALLIKTDSSGNVTWAKTYGSGGNGAYSVQQTTEGGYVFGGLTANYDMLLCKTDASGDVQWAKGFGSTGNDWAFSVQQSSDGGYILAGTYDVVDGYVVKTDTIGNLLWSNIYGTNDQDRLYCVMQAMDGGFIISGQTIASSTGAFYLIKTDSSGNSLCNQNIAATTTTTLTFSAAAQILVVYTSATIDSFSIAIGNSGTDTSLCLSMEVSPTLPGEDKISIYPNPATDNFRIDCPGIINHGTVEIYNVFGQRIIEYKLIQLSGKEINVENISKGIYIVKVIDGEMFYSKKLIIR